MSTKQWLRKSWNQNWIAILTKCDSLTTIVTLIWIFQLVIKVRTRKTKMIVRRIPSAIFYWKMMIQCRARLEFSKWFRDRKSSRIWWKLNRMDWNMTHYTWSRISSIWRTQWKNVCKQPKNAWNQLLTKYSRKRNKSNN